MEVANASLYDGATACVEAVMMANRLTRRGRVVLSGGLHPHYREVCETYARFVGFEVAAQAPAPSGGEDLAGLIGRDTSCVVVQNPDFFGEIRDYSELAQLCHQAGALLVVVVTEILSLGAIRPPGEMGADIVAAEGQSFGNALNFGGPHVGLFASREKFVRQMPGRLVGETVDAEERRGWVLTLSTREQHIRREKATSNICTNAGLCALAFTIHLALLGEAGLTRLARINHAAAARRNAGCRCAGQARRSRRHPGQPLLSRAAGPRRSVAGGGDRDGRLGGHRPLRRRAQGGAAMSEWSQALSARPAPDAAMAPTVSGNRGLQIEEMLLFEQDSPGHCGVDLPEPPAFRSRLNGLERKGPIGLPGLSEPQIVRHFTRLSQKNYAIDSGLYPLGSCTMKHNPRLNEKMARLPGLAEIHPLQPVSTVPGALELIDTLAHWLKTLTGMPAVALSPAAGAHGELCGLMAIRAALEARSETSV